MKKIRIIIIAMVILMLCGWCSHYEHHYIRQAIVTDVECIVITVEDNSGHCWSFYGDDYKVDDEVTLYMYDSMTPNNIYDDVIKEVR